MYSLHKFKKRVENLGKPLPTPFPTLAKMGVYFRYGSQVMIAGRPGAGKSILALNLLVYWALNGKDVLYFSADSDESTVARRVASILTSDPFTTVDSAFNIDNTSRYEEALRAVKEHSRVIYRQLDMEGIAFSNAGFEAVWHGYPDVVVIDNLVNFVRSPDDYGGMLGLLREFDSLARESKNLIVVLHHAKIDDTDEGVPPSDWEITGRLTQIPRVALTAGSRDSRITLACVKNTNGPQNPSADQKGWMHFSLQPNLQVIDESEMRVRQATGLVGQLTGMAR